MFIYRFIIVTALVYVLQMFIYDMFAHKKIRYTRYFDRSFVFEGDNVAMVEEISNAKVLPLPWLRIESKISSNLDFGGGTENLSVRHESLHTSLFALLPYTKITRFHSVRCTKRGEYELSSIYISCGSLFGGESGRKSEQQAEARLTVYPRIRRLDELTVTKRNIFGEILMKRWIIHDPFMLAGINEYTYSEPMNLINWKATARHGALRVNNLDFSTDRKIMILLNTDQTEEQWTAPENEDEVEKLITLAASFAYKSITSGSETGLATNASQGFNQTVPVLNPESGNIQLHRILKTLAGLKYVRHKSFHAFIKALADESTVKFDCLILTRYDSEKLRNSLRYLERKGFLYVMLTGKDLIRN